MRVPDNWRECPRRGEIIAQKFVPSKTPLDSKYDSDIEEQHRYTIEMIIQDSVKGVGMVVDLTKSTAYYNPINVIELSCKHAKIDCAGFEEPPTREQVQTFISICKRFLMANPKEYIAVHCTHGFNRTGFMIISYLVEVEDWSLTAAYAAFKIARHPGIYKKHYVEELNKRYGEVVESDQEGDEIPLADVMLPSWHKDAPEQHAGLGQEQQPGDTAGQDSRFLHKELLGISSLPKEKSALVSTVRNFVSKALGVKSTHMFPGSQPVTLDSKNIAFLSSEPYKVTWKADGTRLLLAILEEKQIFLIDRDFTIFPVGHGISFWCRENPTKHLKFTLLDGELVMDKVSHQFALDQATEIPRYLAYDLIILNDKPIFKFPFDHRLNVLNREVIEPRQKLIYEKKLDRSAELFGVRLKQFYEIKFSEYLMGDKFKNAVAHETDGLIFQPEKQEYKPFTFPMLLKWKPPELNSLDMLLKVVIDSGLGKVPRKMAMLMVLSGPSMIPFAEMKYTKQLNEFNNKIVECTWDKKTSSWQIMRLRTDKSHPNSLSVANSVWESIMCPIEDHTLAKFIEDHCLDQSKKGKHSQNGNNQQQQQSGDSHEVGRPPHKLLKS